MKGNKKILAAYDLSDFAAAAVRYAAGLADDLSAELVIANVINQRDIELAKKIEREYPPFSMEKYFEEQTTYRTKNNEIER